MEINEIISYCGQFHEVNYMVYIASALLGVFVGVLIGKIFYFDSKK